MRAGEGRNNYIHMSYDTCLKAILSVVADYYGDGGLDSGTGGVGGGGGGGTGGSSHFRPDPLGSDSSFHGHGRPPYTPIGRSSLLY